jgi:DNA-binding response OmpR family regulator
MKKLNILIVEDESLLALEFSTTIKKYGHTVVDYVTNATKAREVMQKEQIDLIIMDINLGREEDGIDLYKSFESNAMLIYLTAYQDAKTISKAVETQPLGYLIKPHNENELFALLKLAEIKIQNADNRNININLSQGYTFNTKEEILYRNGSFIKLSSHELILLKLLLQNRGNAVSYKTIEDEIWQDSAPGASSLRTLLYRLRGKLGHELISSEPNYGVKLHFD